MRAQRLALAARLLAGFQRRDAVLADAPRAPLLDLGGLGGDEVAPLEALVARVVEPVGIVGAAVAPAQRRLVGRLIGRLVWFRSDPVEFYLCNPDRASVTT